MLWSSWHHLFLTGSLFDTSVSKSLFKNFSGFYQIEYAHVNINLARGYHCDRLEETNTMIPAMSSNFTVHESRLQGVWRLKMTYVSSFNQWQRDTPFFQTDFISDLVFWFHRELMIWTIGSGYVLSWDRSNAPDFSLLFSFSFYFKTWFRVYLRRSIICTAPLIRWI